MATQQPHYIKRILNGMLIVVFALSVGLALSIPNTILTDSDTLSAMADVVARISPSIDGLTKISAFPEVTRFVLTVMWIAVLPQFAIWVYLFLTLPIPAETLARARKKRLLTIIIFLFAIPALLFSFLFVIGSTPLQADGGRTTERITRLFSQSHFWLGIAAAVFSFTIALLGAGLIYSIRFLPKLFGENSK